MGNNETLQTTTTTTTKKSYEWNVDYAKFFAFPNTTAASVSSSSSSLLRPLNSKQMRQLKGTWVPCSSPNVALHIHTTSLVQPTIVVSFNGFSYEEHYVSRLNFLWPQGHGLDDSSVRGSRVIFACYKDKMNQVQKFAVRFSSSQECQKFVEVLKCLKDGREANFSSLIPSTVHSEGTQRENIHTTQSVNPERALVPNPGSQQGASGCAPEISDLPLPDNLTALTANCFTSDGSGSVQAPAEIDLNSFLGVGSNANKPLIDLLEKVDNIIVGLGGDLKFVGAEA